MNELIKLFHFSWAGIILFLLNLFVTWSLTEIGGLNYVLSYSIALSIVIITSFFLSLKVIFRVKTRYRIRFIKYTIAYFVFLGANILLVRLLTEVLHLHYLFSIIQVTGALFLIKFFTYNRYIFIDKN
jgi:putative flippase GtrA